MFFIFCLTAFLMPGCVLVSHEFKMTRNAILDEIGDVDLETEVQLQIGPALLSFSRMVISLADHSRESAMAVSYLRDINNVQIGIYKLIDVNRNKPLTIPSKIARKLEKKGYEPLVKAKQRDGSAWVMTKMRGKRLTSMYVIALDKEELVIVEIEGRLGSLIEKAIHNHGLRRSDFKRIS
jgi:hypothetical protein